MLKKYHDLINEAHNLPGDTKVALLEEATRIADLHLDKKESYAVRMKLTEAAVEAGRGEKAILAFAWCLNEFDQHSDQYSAYDLMWNYKWIVSELISFPQISRQKIEESMLDLRQRFLSYGYSERYYYKAKMAFAEHIGDIQAMEEYYHKWLAEPEDWITDCSACEHHRQATALIMFKRYEEAYHVAKPILENKLGCLLIPHVTYSSFLIPLLYQNQQDKAAEFHRKGLEMIEEKTPHLYAASNHLRYLTIVDLNQAINLFEKYLPVAIASTDPQGQFYFYRAAVIFFQYLDDKTSVLQMPKGVTPSSLERELSLLAEKFDHRNSTNAFKESMIDLHAEIDQLKKRVS